MIYEKFAEEYGGKPRLFILTLNWNGEDKLKKLIPSLNEVVKELDAEGIENEWLVKDNGSKDGSIDLIHTQYNGEHHVFDEGHNRDSFAKGMNFLCKQSDADMHSDIFLFLNNDVVIGDPKSIIRMLALMEKVDAEVVGARLLYENTNKLQHAGVIFSERYNRLPYHYRPGEESDKNAKKNRYFQAVTAACCLVSSVAYDQIGGMDEGFRWAFDDVDLCLSIGQWRGRTGIAYCGETTIYHEESASLKKNPVNKMFLGKNVERFRKKWNGKYEIDHELYLKNPKYKEIK